jgi:hypothetical protein
MTPKQETSRYSQIYWQNNLRIEEKVRVQLSRGLGRGENIAAPVMLISVEQVQKEDMEKIYIVKSLS